MIFTTVGIAVICIVLFAVYNVYWFYNYRQEIRTPGPLIPVAIIGPAIEFGWFLFQLALDPENRYWRPLRRFKKYGPIWGLRNFFGRKVVFIANPDDLEHVLKTNFKNYVKGDKITKQLEPLFGQGIFNVDGSKWKEQRKIASHMFKTRSIREMVETFCHHGQKVIALLDDHASSGSIVDVYDVFSSFTLDSIGEIAFGVLMNSMSKNEESKKFAKAFNTVNTKVTTLLITNLNAKILSYFGLVENVNKEMKEALEILDKRVFCYKLMRVS
mmetsp:Transcript_7964/g.8783  ORF Transcript_7964/g.8783 Transcript_7964/m.8783 type:complete len:271 (-) Transcript_7964:866-1678(-)